MIAPLLPLGAAQLELELGLAITVKKKKKKRLSAELIYVFKWKAVLAEVNYTVFRSFKIHGSLIPQDVKQTKMIHQDSL